MKENNFQNSIPFSEYPRPQMKRDSFFNLNGTWKLNDKDILVPFPPESQASNFNGKINSDLDKKVFSAFSQELKVQLASITKQAEAELSKKISEMTNGAISQINIFNDIQGKINNSNNTIDAMKKELENKKKQIELYLTEQVNTAIDGAKKEVENRLKDSISNDVKDKFLNLGKGKF